MKSNYNHSGIHPLAQQLHLGLFLVIVAGVLLAATAQARPHKLRVDDPKQAAQLQAQGATLLADYGAFQLWEIADDPVALSAGSRVQLADEFDRIELNTGTLDTRTPAVAALRKAVAPFAGSKLHLVQFVGPVKPGWHDEIEKCGARIVTYIPNNAYLIYADSAALAKIQSWAGAAAYVQWEGAYEQSYKVHPAAKNVDAKGLPREIGTDAFTIQMVEDAAANAATVAVIGQHQLTPPVEDYKLIGYRTITVRLPADQLDLIAAQPDVVSIQPSFQNQKFDERQDQIVAGNLSGSVPSGPGYLAWLASKGFTQAQFDASGFAVDVSDSGIDNGTATPGHFGLYVAGDPGQPSRVIYNRLEGTANSGSTISGCDGHGNLNTHIISGYNDFGPGFPHTDATGFHYGLGVCPFVRVGSSVVFDPETYTSPNLPNLQSRAYRDGSRVSNNSWGANTAGAYNATAQTFDALVRDAQPSTAAVTNDGNQQMVIVFAAGNAGPGAQTVGSPGTAKNVFVVGAEENVNSHSIANGGNSATGSDGCSTPDTDADNVNDLASFSSRGPCSDGRKKPDIAAPGTHVTGGVGQDVLTTNGTGTAIACFAGTGVCALPGGGTVGSVNNFFPLNQQFYTTSSGTSHSTPAIAGACALLRQYFINAGLTPPSPAMTKAFLMNSARYMTGTNANDTLPSSNQGMGAVNMGTAFDGVPRVLRDQVGAEKFTASGQTRTYAGVVSDPSKPFRVTVAWTDAPGSTSGNAYNNNLDLTVTVGGVTYLGNVFTGANSTTGGTADAKNNVESVFVPAGVSGGFVVTVTAANINSDGVPNEAPATDQDFSLVIYNANLVPTPVVGVDSTALTGEGCDPTNGVVDPGETVTVAFTLRNVGTSNTTSVVATLLATNGVTNPSGPQNYGALIAGGSAASRSFTFTATGACGTAVSPMLQLQDGAVNLGTASVTLPLGALATVFSENFDSAVPPALPASWTTAASGGEANWVTTTALRDTLPNSAFAADAATAGVNELDSPSIVVPSAGAQISFRHNYTTESGYDGGVLEIKIGAGAYTDILAAGGSFVSGGYNATISGTSDPLTGRQGWSGSSGGFITTVVNLPASTSGQTIQLRWRLGSDSSVGAAGWYIDSLAISAPSCCGVVAPPIASFTGTPTSGGAPLTVVFSDTSFGLITNRLWNFGNGATTNTTATSVAATYATAGSYDVSLTAIGPVGSNTLTRTAYVVATNSTIQIVTNGYTILAESCANGALDPNEQVTLNLNLRNAGSLGATNLIATLQASGGLVFPSGPQNYGALAAGGAAVGKPFTFVLSGSCGGTNFATLQLQDGSLNLGTISFFLPLGQFASSFTENFDGAVAPALPAGWTTATSGAQSLWVTSAATPDTAPNGAFSTDAAGVGVNELVTPVIALPGGSAQLVFRNNYNLEPGYDGGVLEISIGGGAFTDIISAGGSFVTGAYNRTISSSFSNPLAGRQAWSGNAGGYTNTIVNLPAAAAGQNIQLKWRCGSDSSVSAVGWNVDTISLSTLTCCDDISPKISVPGVSAGQFQFQLVGKTGSNYVVQVSSNLIGNNWIPVLTNPAPFLFTDTNLFNYPLRFYRARLAP